MSQMLKTIFVAAIALCCALPSFAAQTLPTACSVTTGQTLPDATAGKSYQVSLRANGGQGPYSFSLSKGALPQGIAVRQDLLFGTPNTAGQYLFELKATDATGCSALATYTMVVNAQSNQCQHDLPRIVAPANGAQRVASPVPLTWTDVAGVREFHVFASAIGDPLREVGTTRDTQLIVPFPQGEVSWYVEAAFDGCPSTISQRYSFTVTSGNACGTTAPRLDSPANNATNAGAEVEFKWGSVPNVSAYRLFVSRNAGPFEATALTTETEARRLLPPGTFDWYVEATIPSCDTLRSATFRFTLANVPACGTGAVTLISPQNGVILASPVAFSWSPVSGASRYRLWVSFDASSATAVAQTTETAATAQLPSGAAEWYVEALFDNCPSILSAHGTFTVQRAANCGGAAPALISPLSSSGNSVEFKWSASPGAIGYRVWTAKAGQPFADLRVVRDTRVTHVLNAGTFNWYVEALFEGCPAIASSKAQFKIEATAARCSTDSPATISPADGSTNVSYPVTFVWKPVLVAEEYRIFAIGISGDPILLGVTEETSLTRPLPPGLIVWFVEATFKRCPSTYSPRARFTVARAANCTSQKPQPISPADGASGVTSPVTFVWKPVTAAVRYVVMAQTENGAATPIAETESTQLTRPIPTGTIEWWVIALIGGCDPAVSDHARFTIPALSGCDAHPPLLLTPPEGSERIPSPAVFSWTPVRGAARYKLWVASDNQEPSLLATSTTPGAKAALPAGAIHWYVEVEFSSCPSIRSAVSKFGVIPPQACGTPEVPFTHAVGKVLSGTLFKVRWSAVANAGAYEVQESRTPDFANPTTQVVSGLWVNLTRDAATRSSYFYRVRAINGCNDERGQYSDTIRTDIIPANGADRHATAELGLQQSVIQTIVIPGAPTPVSFTARADKPWMTVTPSSGVIPTSGLTLTVTADPSVLALGANTGTVLITYGVGGKKPVSNAAQPASVPVSVSLVTPVGPSGRNTPPPDALIIAAVAHAAGANGSQFESDVRILNTSSQTMNYQLNFTPSGVDGTQVGSFTTIQIDPGATAALDDILNSFFGTSSDESATGMLEIRPLTTTATPFTGTSTKLTTVASSRTFNSTPAGTFGQFIGAIPYSQFIGKSATGAPQILSLQQISQSAAYRTNFGLVEASGEAATVVMRVYDNLSKLVAEIPVSLQPAEHKKLDRLLEVNGITLQEGRVEVEVTSATGKVSAYASTIDNRSGDPLLVPAVLKAGVSGTRYVIPGVAFTNSGNANWRSDIRLFNTSSSAAGATLTYYPQGSATAAGSVNLTIQGGEVRALDNVLNTTFGITGATPGGSILVTTPSASSLIATARTYAQKEEGTYGQFIPAVTANESAALGERPLQILQLEQSANFRTNIGVVETTGKSVVAEVSLILPDSKVTPKVQIPLAANGFLQFPLSNFGVGDAIYNARVTVKVLSGAGKVAAYGSVIDALTADPTYVPAQ